MLLESAKILIFGYGYSGQYIAKQLRSVYKDKIEIAATTRNEQKLSNLKQANIIPLILNNQDETQNEKISKYLLNATHIIMCAAPDENGDPFLHHYFDILKQNQILKWIGYLSTTGVYEYNKGEKVDENSLTLPVQKRSILRLEAENAWRKLIAAKSKANFHVPALNIFRLGGIYGPERSAFERLRNGQARRIIKEGQIFSRIHVEDIAHFVVCALEKNHEGVKIYNLVDDEPCPPQDVIVYAAKLLNMAPPPEIPFEEAALSQMGKSFYAQNKWVLNNKIKDDLDISLRYPNYRIGLDAIFSSLKK